MGLEIFAIKYSHGTPPAGEFFAILPGKNLSEQFFPQSRRWMAICPGKFLQRHRSIELPQRCRKVITVIASGLFAKYFRQPIPGHGGIFVMDTVQVEVQQKPVEGRRQPEIIGVKDVAHRCSVMIDIVEKGN